VEETKMLRHKKAYRPGYLVNNQSTFLPMPKVNG